MISGKELFGEIKQKRKKIFLLARRSIFSENGLVIYAHYGATMGP